MATLETRWGRRLGLGVAASAVVLAIATTTLGAPTVEGRPPPACTETAAAAPFNRTAWQRIEPVLAKGARAAQRLVLGIAGGPTWTIPLDAESFASGPDSGRVVFATDDGRRSTITIVDLAHGCTRAIAVASDVVRSAVLGPDDETTYEHRVGRADRDDLGIWRRSPLSGDAERILPPIEPDARFGITFLTTLQWSADGRHLGIASCGEVACRLRVLDTSDGSTRTVAEPALGELVGITADQAVMRGACRGLPCPIVAIDLDQGLESVIAEGAGTADLVVDDAGRPVVAFEHGGPGGPLTLLPLGGAQVAAQTADVPEGLRIADHDADINVDVPRGWVLLSDNAGPEDPAAWIRDARFRRLADGAIRRLDEVLP
ncbi:MAG: hypothetical protein WEC14_04400 [Chloroflexota bacterium]